MVPRKKIVLLISALNDCRMRLDARLKQLAAASALPEGTRCSLLLEHGEMATLPHQVVMRDSPPPYDAVVEFIIETGDRAAEDAAAYVAGDLAALIDTTRSTAICVREYQITSGDGPIHVAMPLRRLPTLTHEAFMECWFGRHAELGAAVEGVRYRQNHVMQGETGMLISRLGFSGLGLDGLTLSYFDGTAEAETLLSSPMVRDDAIADERTFIDHARSQFGVYRIVSRRG